MLEYSRNCVLDLCDLDGNKVCPIYDSSVEIPQFAKDIFKSTERNGWKTITFTLESPDRDVENFITTYIKPEYKIRLIDDDGTDWYILDKPKITHSSYSKKYSITAEHCSAILKYRRLDLEFSTENLNNVGTCEQLLTLILEGTGWEVGTVSEFREKYEPHDIKKRTMQCASKTGAFNMIAKMCDLFEAKPIYNGDTKVVDILPLNPFSDKTIDPTTGLPDLSKAKNVYEIDYGVNMTSMTKSEDSSTIITKLNVYGSYGDVKKGYCGISELTHKEYKFDIPAAGNYYITIENPFDSTQIYANFTTTDSANDVLFSNLDRTSMLYVYDDANDTIYKVTLSGVPIGTEITTTTTNVKNWVPFITDFTYYVECGLLTDEQLYDIAYYQNVIPEIMKKTYEANIQFTNDWSTLTSLVGGTDFVKLDVQSCVKEGDNYVIYLTEDEIQYRTDYDEVPLNYFEWKTSNGLKTNGDSTNAEASLIYIIHATGSKTYERTYIKAISDVSGAGRKLTLWSDITNQPSTDQYYLFQSASVNGKVGGIEVTEMSVIDSGNAYPKGDTVQHPVYWGAVDASLIGKFTEYAWLINTSPIAAPIVYFCYKQNGDLGWMLSAISTTEPSAATYYYWYNPNSARVYYAVAGAWVLFYDKDAAADEEWKRRKKIYEKFSQVQLYIDQYEQCWKGIYDQYCYTCGTLPAGNYYYADPYNNGYLFTNNSAMTSSDKLMLNTTTGWITPTHYSGATVDILAGATWTLGTIDTAGNIYDAYTTEITNAITVSDNMIYDCVGSNFVLTWYNKSGLFVKQDKIEISKSIASPANAAILRVTRQLSASISMTTNGTNYDAIQTDVVKLYTSTITRHAADIADGVSWTSGKINASGGDIDDNTKQRTTWLTAYENTQYHMTAGASVQLFFYSSKSIFISSATLTSGAVVISPAQTHYIRLVKDTGTTVKVQVVDYDLYVISDGKQYKILTPWVGMGELNGLYNLVPKFNTYADATYITDRDAIVTLQQMRADLESDLVDSLGEIYKENTWQDANYVEGDEKKLFSDAVEKLDEASRPTVTYDIGFLDLYKSDINEYIQWPDIDINSALHVMDEQMEENRWAFVDKVNKCYDCPWKTTLSVNTKLTTVANKTFSDVMTELADVTSSVKASDGIVDAVSDITSGKDLVASKIAGALDVSKAKISGAASSWSTDEKGNILFESSLGTSAMKLCGDGLAIANRKDEFGDWEWTTFGTGDGFTADLINAGTIRGNLIEAGSITTDQVTSTFGNELVISSNKSLLMFATVDGTRPAGAVNVTKEGESWISIDKDNGIILNTGANINMVAGNTVNMSGATVNIQAKEGTNSAVNISGGDVDIAATSSFTAHDSTGNEFILDKDGATVKGQTIKLLTNSSVNGTIVLGDSKNTINSAGVISLNNGSLVLDGSNTGNGKITTTGDIELSSSGENHGSLTVKSGADINVEANGDINVAGGNVNVTSNGNFTVASTGKMDIQSGSTLTVDSPNFKVNTAGQNEVSVTGTIYASAGQIGCDPTTKTGGWYIGQDKIYSGTGTSYVELNSAGTDTDWAVKIGGSGDPKAADAASFAVQRDGSVVMKDMWCYTDDTKTKLQKMDIRSSLWKMDVAYSRSIIDGQGIGFTKTDEPDGSTTLTIHRQGTSKDLSVNFTSAGGTEVRFNSGLTTDVNVETYKEDKTFKSTDGYLKSVLYVQSGKLYDEVTLYGHDSGAPSSLITAGVIKTEIPVTGEFKDNETTGDVDVNIKYGTSTIGTVHAMLTHVLPSIDDTAKTITVKSRVMSSGTKKAYIETAYSLIANDTFETSGSTIKVTPNATFNGSSIITGTTTTGVLTITTDVDASGNRQHKGKFVIDGKTIYSPTTATYNLTKYSSVTRYERSTTASLTLGTQYNTTAGNIIGTPYTPTDVYEAGTPYTVDLVDAIGPDHEPAKITPIADPIAYTLKNLAGIEGAKVSVKEIGISHTVGDNIAIGTEHEPANVTAVNTQVTYSLKNLAGTPASKVSIQEIGTPHTTVLTDELGTAVYPDPITPIGTSHTLRMVRLANTTSLPSTVSVYEATTPHSTTLTDELGTIHTSEKITPIGTPYETTLTNALGAEGTKKSITEVNSSWRTYSGTLRGTAATSEKVISIGDTVLTGSVNKIGTGHAPASYTIQGTAASTTSTKEWTGDTTGTTLKSGNLIGSSSLKLLKSDGKMSLGPITLYEKDGDEYHALDYGYWHCWASDVTIYIVSSSTSATTYYTKGTSVGYSTKTSLIGTPIYPVQDLTYYPADETLYKEGTEAKYIKTDDTLYELGSSITTAGSVIAGTILYTKGTEANYYPADVPLYESGSEVRYITDTEAPATVYSAKNPVTYYDASVTLYKSAGAIKTVSSLAPATVYAPSDEIDVIKTSDPLYEKGDAIYKADVSHEMELYERTGPTNYYSATEQLYKSGGDGYAANDGYTGTVLYEAGDEEEAIKTDSPLYNKGAAIVKMPNVTTEKTYYDAKDPVQYYSGDTTLYPLAGTGWVLDAVTSPGPLYTAKTPEKYIKSDYPMYEKGDDVFTVTAVHTGDVLYESKDAEYYSTAQKLYKLGGTGYVIDGEGSPGSIYKPGTEAKYIKSDDILYEKGDSVKTVNNSAPSVLYERKAADKFIKTTDTLYGKGSTVRYGDYRMPAKVYAEGSEIYEAVNPATYLEENSSGTIKKYDPA